MRVQRIAIAIGMILTGCTVSPPRMKPSDPAITSQKSVPTESPAAAALEEPGAYTYELLTPEQTKLVQVFDDTRRTYLTFAVDVPLGLLIFDESGRAMTFTVGERTVIVAGVRAGSGERPPGAATRRPRDVPRSLVFNPRTGQGRERRGCRRS